MIKNVVFDLGQVLYRFVPKELVAGYVTSEEDARLVAEVAFDRLYWDKLDMGTIEDEELLRLACERLPERLHDACREAYYNWIYNMPEVDGMAEVVARVKKTGKRVFVLSNISKYFAAHASEFGLLSEFEKCVFSAEVGFVKPQKEIYLYLLDEAGIRAEETLFIDDSEKNIAGAAAIGIHTYLFDGDASRLESYISTI